ncbi:uncharacterized protein [Ambystoma mexicanum]|uniref:uncharacterized protein n=1 Tax=Ambystoma mexicanum TaxID=8296 RepID=UPI0037E88E9E
MANPSAEHEMLENLGFSPKQALMLAYNLNKAKPEKQIGNISVYKVPYKQSFVREAVYQKLTIGQERVKVNEKVILMLGETGAGKSTLINVLINYILGVEWKDKFRFQLLDEQTNKSQAYSQTSMITAYEIHCHQGSRVPFPITVVDTPGFATTSGPEKDKMAMKQLKEFFSSPEYSDHLNAVCIVIKASSSRLTKERKYVDNLVYSIFGKNLANNILFMFTFADPGEPPALASISGNEHPFLKKENGPVTYFKFNSWTLFEDNAADESPALWKMATKSMEMFFEQLETLTSISLVLTNEVLLQRAQIETALQNLLNHVRAGFTKLQELRQTENALREHWSDMEQHKDFTYEVKVTIKEKQKINRSAMNCKTCESTCHHPCVVVGNPFNYFCEMIGFRGNCKICVDNCAVGDHVLESVRWTTREQKETREYADLKKKYEAAQGKALDKEQVIERIRSECLVVNETIGSLIEQCCKRMTRLKEIALKPDPLTTPEYIDVMIKREEQMGGHGSSERVQCLRELKEQAVILTKIQNKEKLLPEEKIQSKVKITKKQTALVHKSFFKTA